MTNNKLTEKILFPKRESIDAEKIWCAEYSVKEDAFYIETLAKCIKRSHDIFLSENVVDYNIIGVFSSKLEANECINHFIQLYGERTDFYGNK